MNKDVMGVQEVSPGYEFVAENPAVPVGYKQTEVGVIPEDWGAVQLRDIGIVIRGASPRPKGDKRFYGGGIPRLMVEDVTRDGKYVTPKVDFLTTEGAMRSRPCKAGTLTLVCSGTVGVPAILKVDACIHDGFLALVNLKDTVNVEYLYYQFEMLRALFDSSATHGGVFTNLTTTGVKEFRVAIPSSPEEQRAIATALSDMDALLEELDRLIAKKRDIKQAAMQQLLTGKTRLPGFDGEWESFRLGDHVTFLKTGTNSRAELQSDGNDASVRYLHYGDIHASKASFMDSSALPFLPSEKAATLGRLQNGDLIMSDASEDIEGIGKSVEITNVGTADVVAGLHTIAARFSPDVLADGFKAYLQYCPAFITPLRRLAAGTKVYATTRKHIESIEMQLPGLEEQVAIAHVFKDMDTEIQALEQRRSKTAELKQGMMQELLTGRTRLV
jgi:type I restriction enzyme S subunit